VKVLTRMLNDVTSAVPEIVEAAQRLPARALVLDGEALAFRPDGIPHPFQVTMRRFGRKLDVAQMRGTLPLMPFFFDCLHLEGEDLIDRTAQERVATLQTVVPAASVTPRLVTMDMTKAEAFLREALSRGHEGVMAKALDAPYQAGRRGSAWLKIKRAHTLDLVVLAAEWGNGRRQGWLSNLHLGARDAATGAFVMLGKTFPLNDIRASRHYPGGLARRFARVKRYRPDKTPEQADTIETVRAFYAKQGERQGGIS